MMVRSKVCHSWYYCRGHSISISISKTNVARCQLSEEIWQGWERCHREARRCSCCQWDVTCYPELAPSEFCSSRQQKASRLSDCLDPGGGDDDWVGKQGRLRSNIPFWVECVTNDQEQRLLHTSTCTYSAKYNSHVPAQPAVLAWPMTRSRSGRCRRAWGKQANSNTSSLRQWIRQWIPQLMEVFFLISQKVFQDYFRMKSFPNKYHSP